MLVDFRDTSSRNETSPNVLKQFLGVSQRAFRFDLLTEENAVPLCTGVAMEPSSLP
jgi:hypothetical protein